MENHALHGYGIYYETDDTLFVNLFAPSTARVPGLGVQVAMDTSFPDGDSATIVLSMPEIKQFTLAVRRPSWAGDGFAVKVNGQDVPQPTLASLQAGRAGGRLVNQDPRVLPPSTFVELDRAWKSGDTVQLSLPKSVRYEFTPDDSTVTAIMWGPLALAADHGPRLEGRAAFAERKPVPALVAADRPMADWMQADAGTPGNFVARGVARAPEAPTPAADLEFKPFYRTYERNYSLYYDLLTPAEFDARVAAIAAERERQQRLEAATMGFVRPGNRQDESTANYQSSAADRPVQRTGGRSARGGAGWFSYDLPVDAASTMALVVTYYNDPGLTPTTGDFAILVDGTEVAKFAPDQYARNFFDATYAVPGALTRGKKWVTVRFDGGEHGRVAPVFGVRMVRADRMPR
jgi:hypothetical protein